MPSPKTTKCIKLLCILWLCRISVYAHTDAVPLARIDHTSSVSEKSLELVENKNTNLTYAVYKPFAKMLTYAPRKEEVMPCKPGLQGGAASALMPNANKIGRQLQNKLWIPNDKAVQNGIPYVELPAFKNVMQQNSMSSQLFGTPVKNLTREEHEGLPTSAQARRSIILHMEPAFGRQFISTCAGA